MGVLLDATTKFTLYIKHVKLKGSKEINILKVLWNFACGLDTLLLRVLIGLLGSWLDDGCHAFWEHL